MHHSLTWTGRINSVLLISSSIVVASLAPSPAAQDSIRPHLAAAQCQPLTDANYALCCIAINRRIILSSDQLDQCPPLTTSLIAATLAHDGNGNTQEKGDGSGTGDPGGKGGDDGGKGGNDGGKGGNDGGNDGGKGGDSGRGSGN